MIKNFALITFSGEGLSVAKKFQDKIGTQGRVVVGMIENSEDIYLPQEIEAMKADGKDPNDEDGQKERFKLYDGILDVIAADELIKFLQKQNNKDEWFVFTDMNYCFKYATMAAEFMPYGNFPTAEHRMLEVDRNKGKEFIEQYYKDVSKDKHWEFKTVDEALKFLETSDDVLVLKGDGVDAPTVVPPTEDVEAAKQILQDALEKNKDKYNAGGLIFEVKLDDAVELTPERVYMNGVALYNTLDIETKRKYAGDVGGELVGCGTDLVITTDSKDKLNQIAFPPIVDEMAKQAKGMFIWDISLLISRSTGKMYPGEFCANRPGWNAFVTELEGLDVVQFFNDIVDMKNPLKDKKASSSLRVFNDDLGVKGSKEVKIIYPEEIESHVWLIDAKKTDDGLVTVGYMSDVGMVTGTGQDFISSVDALYESMSKFVLATKRWGYRDKGDYLSNSYSTAIVNRFNYAVQKGLITGYEPYLGNKEKSVADMESDHESALQTLRNQNSENMKKVTGRIHEILNANS